MTVSVHLHTGGRKACSSRVLVIPAGRDTAEASNSGVTENVFFLLESVCAHPSVAVFVIYLYKYSFSFFLSPSLRVLSPTANLAPTPVCSSVFVRNTETEMVKECYQQPTLALFFVKQTCSLSDVIFV